MADQSNSQGSKLGQAAGSLRDAQGALRSAQNPAGAVKRQINAEVGKKIGSKVSEGLGGAVGLPGGDITGQLAATEQKVQRAVDHGAGTKQVGAIVGEDVGKVGGAMAGQMAGDSIVPVVGGLVGKKIGAKVGGVAGKKSGAVAGELGDKILPENEPDKKSARAPSASDKTPIPFMSQPPLAERQGGKDVIPRANPGIPRRVKCPNCPNGVCINPDLESFISSKGQYNCNHCNTYVAYQQGNPEGQKWWCPVHKRHFDPNGPGCEAETGEHTDDTPRNVPRDDTLPPDESRVRSDGTLKPEDEAIRGVNKGRRSQLQKLADARRAANKAGRMAGDPGGALEDSTLGQAKNLSQKALLRGMNFLAEDVIGKLPVIGTMLKAKGAGSVMEGISAMAVGNPLFRFVLDRTPGVPKRGTGRVIANCACGACTGCGNCTGCGGCSCGTTCGGCALPAAIILIVILIGGSVVTSQPSFVPDEFCAQYHIQNCDTVNGGALNGQPTDVTPAQMLTYQMVESATGVPWFYIAAWEKIATNYGVAPAAQAAPNRKLPTSAIDSAQADLELTIAQLYPDLAKTPQNQGPGTGAADTPGPSASATAPVAATNCDYTHFINAVTLTFNPSKVSHFVLTTPGSGSAGGKIEMFSSPQSYESISYNLDGSVANEMIYINGQSWSRVGDAGAWGQSSTTTDPATMAFFSNPYIGVTADQFKQYTVTTTGGCSYIDNSNNIQVLRTDLSGLPQARAEVVGGTYVSATYDYSRAVSIAAPAADASGPLAPSSGPGAVSSAQPATTVGPTPGASNLTQLQTEQAAADKMRANLKAQIANLASDLRGGSFGPFLVTNDEWQAYGKISSATPLDPFDEQDAGTIIAQHMVDVYNKQMQYLGTVSFPGTPLSAQLDTAVATWIDAQWGDSTWATFFGSLVTDGIQNIYKTQIGWATGPAVLWPDGPGKGLQVTTAERYYICNRLATTDDGRKLCSVFAVNANNLTLEPTTDPSAGFATTIKHYYDPTKPLGQQVSDYGALQVLMGALLSEGDIWGMQKGATFLVNNVTTGGQAAGGTSQVNAYAKAISTYALSLYANWLASKVAAADSGINGVSGLDSVEFSYWQAAIDATTKRTGLPWQYLAATAHADNLFACVNLSPANLEPDDVTQAINNKSPNAPDPSTYYTGIGIYAGKYLIATNPTGLNDCWRVGVGSAASWQNIVPMSGKSAGVGTLNGLQYTNKDWGISAALPPGPVYGVVTRIPTSAFGPPMDLINGAADASGINTATTTGFDATVVSGLDLGTFIKSAPNSISNMSWGSPSTIKVNGKTAFRLDGVSSDGLARAVEIGFAGTGQVLTLSGLISDASITAWINSINLTAITTATNSGLTDADPQAATNYCGRLDALTTFNGLNANGDNCGSVIIQTLGPDGAVHTLTVPVTGFCDCFAGVVTTDNAVEDTHQTEHLVALNDATLKALGYSPDQYGNFAGHQVIVTPLAPSDPVDWPAGMTGLTALSDAVAKAALSASDTTNDPVRQKIMDNMADKILASMKNASVTPPASSTTANPSASPAITAAPSAAGTPSPFGDATIADWWKVWHDYSGCTLGATAVPITDPITAEYLGSSGTCEFITTADQWARSYIQRSYSTDSLSGAYTPPFVTEDYGYVYKDCTYASALMLINKITHGALDVHNTTASRAIIQYWRDQVNNPYTDAGTFANIAIVPGANSIYNIQLKWSFGSSSRGVAHPISWQQLIDWLDNGNGAELMGYYSNWSDSSPWGKNAPAGKYYSSPDHHFANLTDRASGHAIYLDHRDSATGQILVFDPLVDAGPTYGGRWMDDAALLAFATGVDPVAHNSMGTVNNLYVLLAIDTVQGFTIPPSQRNPYWSPFAAAGTKPGLDETAGLPTKADTQQYLKDQLGEREAGCAIRIFNQEDGSWNPHAANTSRGADAYGLPQANPKSKLGNWAVAKAAAATAAGHLAEAAAYNDWENNLIVQANWGLEYMARRYGSACTAAAFKFGGVGDDGKTYPGMGWY